MIFGAPSIVTNGLILNLDAANNKSYPGSGTTWTDLSGNGRNGSLVSSPTYTTDGPSIRFNGTTQNVELGSIPALQFTNTQAFSVSVWFKWLEASAVFGNLVSYAPSTGLGWYVGLDRSGGIGTNIAYFDYVGSAVSFRGIYTGTNSITTNTWVNVVATTDSTNTVAGMRIYINGTRATTTVRGSASPATPSYAGLTVQIASRANDNTTRLEGNISQVMIHNRELSASEVQQNYNALKSRFNLS
jgi:hypothetical protein